MSEIKKAKLQDAKLLAKIGKEGFLVAHGKSASKKDIDNYVSKNFTEDAFTKELAYPKNEYYLIYHKDKVAGYSKIIFNFPNENMTAQNVTKMERLYLLEEFYGLGLGKELFDFNIKKSKQHNQKGVWLAVWTENQRAINFYHKMGFKILGSYDFKISESHYNPNHILYLNY